MLSGRWVSRTETGQVLVTANTKDFARFKRLKVENWARKARRP